ncbi:MAG: hypothetical protein ABSD71_11365 [Bacteroidales bacterium]
MRKIFLLIFLAIYTYSSAQELVGTKESLILIYNYPGTYFYIELKGQSREKTDKSNCFLIDNKVVQIYTANKNRFAGTQPENLTDIDFQLKYIKWEIDSLQNIFHFNANSKVELKTSKKGKSFAFWTYDAPVGDSPEKTASNKAVPTQSQLFVLFLVKDYIVGLNAPLYDKADFDFLKDYLIKTVDRVVEAPNKIDSKELFKRLNIR